MKKKIFKRAASLTLAAAVAVTGMGLTGCDTGSSGDQVIIYSNADEEAITAMENALDNNGYEGQYMFQTFGTSELGGKLLAEGRLGHAGRSLYVRNLPLTAQQIGGGHGDDEYLLCRECTGSELYVPGSDIRCRYDR